MLSDTIVSTRLANQLSMRLRMARDTRRHSQSLVDGWLEEVENLLENDDKVVPRPLITEISGFLRLLDHGLYRRLQSNGDRDSSQVLAVLFEAQERLLLVLAPTA
jgi:hypothetical protein